MATVVILLIMQWIESGQLGIKLAEAKVSWEAGIIYSWCFEFELLVWQSYRDVYQAISHDF